MSQKKIHILKRDWQYMQQHVTAAFSQEACGLLAGKFDRVSKCYAIDNELHSSTRFWMEPVSQLEAMLDMERLGLELLAYYHSHPRGGEKPSSTDLDEFLYPGVIMLIWSHCNRKWQANAWCIEKPDFFPVQIEVTA
jgi:proteasome lid subunit RPN8/RPN11